MSTITKQWLQQTIAEYEANRDELPFGLDTNSAIELQAFKLALASIEAEPVAWMWEIYGGGHMYAKIKPSSLDSTPLYTAPPAPVSVPDAYIRDERGRMMLNGRPEPRIGYGGGWNAFRAAMLQGAEPVSNRDELTDAVNGLLAVMDEYPESLVPINRDSAVVRQLRSAAGG